MARRSKPERVLGPYRHYRKWRVLLVSAGGAKTVTDYEDEAKARQVVRSLRRELAKGGDRTVQEAREKYEMYMRDDKGNKLRSIAATTWRLGIFFHEDDLLLDELTPEALQGLLRRPADASAAEDEAAAGSRLAPEHPGGGEVVPRLVRGEAVARAQPAGRGRGVGKRRHGKAQLRIDEARRWQAKALEFADQGEAGAVAAMMSLVMGMRASEIVSRVVRDLDDEGRLLWIPETKTEAGRRTLPVPEFLQPYLRQIAKGKGPADSLFGRHWRDWPREWVQRICKAAKVPVVTAHGMRGLHGTLAVERGATTHVVAPGARPRVGDHFVARATSRARRSPAPTSGGCSRCWRAGGAAAVMKPRISLPRSLVSEKNRSDLVEMNGIEPSAS